MTEFINLFEACGKNYLPGKKPNLGGPLDPITPTSMDPEPTDPTIGLGTVATGGQYREPIFKCITTETQCPAPNAGIVSSRTKECLPCLDTNQNPITIPIGGTPPAGYEDCVHRIPTCDDTATPCTPVFQQFPCPGGHKCEVVETPCLTGQTSQSQPPGSNLERREGVCVACDPSTDPLCIYSQQQTNCLGQCLSIEIFTCVSDPDPTQVPDPPDPPDPPIDPPLTQFPGNTGGVNTGLKCVTETIYCPPGSLPDRVGELIGVVDRSCQSCTPLTAPGSPPANAPTSVPGKLGLKIPTVTTSETACKFTNAIDCAAACVPPGPINGYSNGRFLQIESFCNEPLNPANSFGQIIPGDPGSGEQPNLGFGVELPSPLLSVDTPALDLLKIQEKNAKVINVNERLLRQDADILKTNQQVQKIYDKELNFFQLTPDPLKLVSNTSYLNIFNDHIDISIGRVLQLTNTSGEWSEDNFFNITNEKIAASIIPDLLSSFKILRYPGGEVVGLDALLGMIKKHLVTGTISRLDPTFYIESAKSQLQQGFTTLDSALTKDYASRGSINYIIDNGETLSEYKDSERKSIQINRGRFLNEDLDISIPVETLLSSTKSLKVPNEGIALEALTPKTSTTPISVGDSNLLNIGDGGGYYISISSEDGEFPLRTTNLVDSSYYLPDFHKSKVLSLNGRSFNCTITASSLLNQNEFVAGDTGPSVFEPMYFGMNLGTVSSTYTDDPLIESYTATYSRIIDSDQIAKHVNNNAQSLTEFRINYDDPIYRYILDTSGFEITQEDFTVRGFKDASAFSFNFPRNIPFAIVLIPVAGSKFNPLNGRSKLLKYSHGLLRRSLSFKPSINRDIDGRALGRLTSYNLYNEDKSQRIGLVESKSFQSFGFKYDVSNYKNSFYDGNTYTSSVDPVELDGTSYLLREVIDFIAETNPNQTVTWFDLYRRMPFNKYTQLLYDTPPELFEDIKKGFRGGIKPDLIAQAPDSQTSILLPEDSKVVISVSDRDAVKAKEEKPSDADF